jgi:hypothetical protein
LPLCGWIATPAGELSCPAPEPWLPKLLTGLSSEALALAAPSAAVAAHAPTARAMSLATRDRVRHLPPDHL